MAGRNRSEGMGCSGRRLAALAILSCESVSRGSVPSRDRYCAVTMQETCCLPSPSLTQRFRLLQGLRGCFNDLSSSRMGRGGLFIPGGSMKALPGLLRRQARSGMRGGHTQGGQVVEGSRLKRLAAILEVLASLFPLWVVVAVLAAIFKPETVTWLQGNSITVAVGATMVFTEQTSNNDKGMTLTIDDFVRILKDPAQVSMGCLCQYTLMPILGVFISKFLKLPKDIAAGLILLSSCPGGTSSNLITLIAKAAIATPSLVAMNAGSLVKIDPIGLVISTMQVVLGPVACGLAVHHLFPHSAAMAKIFTPFISVIMVSLICGSIIGCRANSLDLRHSPPLMRLPLWLDRSKAAGLLRERRKDMRDRDGDTELGVCGGSCDETFPQPNFNSSAMCTVGRTRGKGDWEKGAGMGRGAGGRGGLEKGGLVRMGAGQGNGGRRKEVGLRFEQGTVQSMLGSLMAIVW
ncbi:hypothetical protein GUITHDRAFT_144786 [Guillardia theta CCMP2712]|uniref:Uncharacterized protein n=1 Tax=Guillardia theta (strain CCMP2712) TaxID=905079 RepID=L1IN13_GUITC|nr:hypothetical protein GUITHDRAFT_144786 [Guillardia theta CCMP2712]EKX37653.1 hypothetical protein GUITHDRAFT_144786 [Guillardia theta CCMP2712]|eukprot:XP_005824633.1 hypothetical protein GUITHDRAFT_144786 [Guillardia theta CCMP2712]